MAAKSKSPASSSYAVSSFVVTVALAAVHRSRAVDRALDGDAQHVPALYGPGTTVRVMDILDSPAGVTAHLVVGGGRVQRNGAADVEHHRVPGASREYRRIRRRGKGQGSGREVGRAASTRYSHWSGAVCRSTVHTAQREGIALRILGYHLDTAQYVAADMRPGQEPLCQVAIPRYR